MTALTRNENTATPTIKGLSAPLSNWLLVESSSAKAVEVIRGSQILRSEAAMALPMLKQAALAPAGDQGVMRTIAKRFSLYPQPDRDEMDWAHWWADYTAVLSDLTEAQIEAGMLAHISSPETEFMPKPGKLRDLALSVPTNSKAVRAYERAKAATKLDKPKVEAVAKLAERTPEEIAKVKAMLSDFNSLMKAKEIKEAPPKRKPVHGPVDQSGITAEGRALIERMRQT